MMTRVQAERVAREMEQEDFNTSLRRYADNSWGVDAVDNATGISVTMNTVEQWQERKRAIEFEAQFGRRP
jgi:hypothetical protein